MSEFPKLPAGFRHPSVHPPGPERDAAVRQLEAHRRVVQEWGNRRMAARRAAEKPDALEEEVKAATRADGSIDHSKLSPKSRERFDTLIRASIVDSALNGPSKRLVAIVGERPRQELARIAEAMGEVALQQTVRKYPFVSVARTVRQMVGDGIKLSDDELRQLLAVGPEPLWRLDQ